MHEAVVRNSENILRLAGPYIRARLSQSVTAGHTMPQPSNLIEAYGVQVAVMEALGRPVLGWKVAVDEVYGAVAAPLDIWSGPHIPLHGGIFFELEVAVVLGTDLPPHTKGAYGMDDIRQSISHICCGVEFIRKRFGEEPDIPFLAGLADGLSHEGYLAGAKASPGDILEQEQFICRVDNCGVKSQYSVPHPLRYPAHPIMRYVNSQTVGCTPLRAGQMITTGSLCGLMAVRQPGRVAVEIEGVGALEFLAV